MHSLSQMLLHSLNHSRILVTAPRCGAHLIDGLECSERDYSCLLKPISSCSFSDTTPVNSQHFSYSNVKTLQPIQPTYSLLGAFVNSSDLHWISHAHCVAFTMRLQPWVRRRVQARFRDTNTVTVYRQFGNEQSVCGRALTCTRSSLDSDLLSRSVALYVRHGNKYMEMPLLNYSAYIASAIQLAATWPHLSQTIFLAIDDHKVITEAMYTLPRNWTLMYTDMLRLKQDPLVPDGKIELLASNTTAGDVFVEQLAQIFSSVESGAWVGTLGSNLCRLINELRCAWLPYAYARMPVFADMVSVSHSAVRTTFVPCP